MREMFRTMFSAVTSFFRAFDFGARTLENYAKWAEGESSGFEMEGRVERAARIRALREKLQIEDEKDTVLIEGESEAVPA